MTGYKHIAGLFVIVFSIIAIISSCKQAGRTAAETAFNKPPVGLVLEKIIEGLILGEKIAEPMGVTADFRGNICFVDAGNSRLVLLDDQFQPIRAAGGYGRAEGLLSEPEYISIDNNHNYYISEAGNLRISIFDFRLNFMNSIDLTDEEDPLKFGCPAGVAVTSRGEIWVADRDNARLALFDSFLKFDHFIGKDDSYTHLWSKPADIVHIGRGEMANVDSRNAEIYLFDSYGILKDTFGKTILREPVGIAVDNNRNFWVIDKYIPGIFCFDSDGNFLFSEGKFGNDTDYSFNQPGDVAVIGNDRLIVSDTGNDRLLIYKILYF